MKLRSNSFELPKTRTQFMVEMKAYNNLLGLIVVSLVTACGGGSDNSSSVSVPTNTAPSFVSDGSLTAVEGDLAIASLEVQDLSRVMRV